jgi:hypothetical protein
MLNSTMVCLVDMHALHVMHNNPNDGAAPGGAMALLLAVLEPLASVTPAETASLSFKVDRASDWCIQSALEPSMAARMVHGLELAISAIIGQAVLFAVALIVNNIGPASKRYPTMWW